MLNDAYDDTYGIYGTTTSPTDPFAPVGSHLTEDVHSTSQYVYYLKRFRDYGVLKHYGLNVIEFMSLPRYEAERILKECQIVMSKDNELLNRLKDELDPDKH